VTGRPRILVVCARPVDRLRLLDRLRTGFDVTAIDDPGVLSRAIRRIAPRLVLLVVPRGRRWETLRLCRSIKVGTGAPPRVALLDFADSVTPAHLEGCDADGYLGGEPPTGAVVGFAQVVLNGERPQIRHPARATAAARLLKRLRSPGD